MLATGVVGCAFAGLAGTASAGPLYSVTLLGDLGRDANGASVGEATAVDAAGNAYGTRDKRPTPTTDLNAYPVRWPAGTTAPVELSVLDTTPTGQTGVTRISGVNAQGDAVGRGDRFSGSISLGNRPVRWAAGGTSLVELDNLGTSASGSTFAEALAINAAGHTVGWAQDFRNGSGVTRPVVWRAGTTKAEALGGLFPTGDAGGWAINDAGKIAGWADRTDVPPQNRRRAAVWALDNPTPQQLPDLPNTPATGGWSEAHAVDAAGNVYGNAYKYSPDGTLLGTQPVRWSADGSTATELGTISRPGASGPSGTVFSVNSRGDAVGTSGSHAALWLAGQNQVVDLNTLIDPASGWVLLQADGINDSGVIVGKGTYDPDGPGPALPQGWEPFRLDLTADGVLEPTAVLPLTLAGLALGRRRARRGPHKE